MSTTQQEILVAVNNLYKSPLYGYSHDYTNILGGITRNASGHVTGARVAQLFWRLEIPDDVEVVHNQGSGLELQLAAHDPRELRGPTLRVAFRAARASVAENRGGGASTQKLRRKMTNSWLVKFPMSYRTICNVAPACSLEMHVIVWGPESAYGAENLSI